MLTGGLPDRIDGFRDRDAGNEDGRRCARSAGLPGERMHMRFIPP